MKSSLNLTTEVIYIILSLVLSPLPLPPHTEQKGGQTSPLYNLILPEQKLKIESTVRKISSLK